MFPCKTLEKPLVFANEMHYPVPIVSSQVRSQDTRVADVIDELQSAGRYTVSTKELEVLCGKSNTAVESAVRRLKSKKRLFSPRQGFLVIVPLEYRTVGAPPPSWFIADLMAYVQRDYYVGLLSAAAIYGAAHHKPQVFQVVTTGAMRDIRRGRIWIQFVVSSSMDSVPIREVQVPTGYIRLSTPEATALDLVRFYKQSGGMSHVATILADLGEEISSEQFHKIFGYARMPELQRLGYILDLVGWDSLTTPLFEQVSAKKPRTIYLTPGRHKDSSSPSHRWRLQITQPLEVDS